MTVMIHDKGLSTDIGWGGRDIYGNNVPTKNRSQVYRMRKWQNRTRASNSADRNLAQALNELNRLASKIGLHRQVREEAAMLYRRAVQDNLVRGRSVEGVAAALVASQREVDEEAGEHAVGLDERGQVVARPAGRKGAQHAIRSGWDLAAEFSFGDPPAFAVDGMITEEARGKALFGGSVGQEITCELPDGEVIPWNVAVKRVDDPVSPRPHGAFTVALVAVRVCVARGVEPGPRHPFAV